jgi:hypothetical protein
MIESKRFGFKKALVDIDETICFYSDKRAYELAEPNFENIAKINQLFAQGWHITYWTGRGESSKRDLRALTLAQLNQWGCQFNELITGYCPNGGPTKPNFDLVIDDKAKRIEEL